MKEVKSVVPVLEHLEYFQLCFGGRLILILEESVKMDHTREQKLRLITEHSREQQLRLIIHRQPKGRKVEVNDRQP